MRALEILAEKLEKRAQHHSRLFQLGRGPENKWAAETLASIVADIADSVTQARAEHEEQLDLFASYEAEARDPNR